MCLVSAAGWTKGRAPCCCTADVSFASTDLSLQAQGGRHAVCSAFPSVSGGTTEAPCNYFWSTHCCGCPHSYISMVGTFMSADERLHPNSGLPRRAEEGDVRLVAEVEVNRSSTGAMQVFRDGGYGAVCAAGFSGAAVGCRQLGLLGPADVLPDPSGDPGAADLQVQTRKSHAVTLHPGL